MVYPFSLWRFSSKTRSDLPDAFACIGGETRGFADA
jgi:hypothetical protein